MNRILILGSIFLLTCWISKIYINVTRRYPGQISKKYYSLSKTSPNYSDAIDTSSVYLFSSERSFNGEPDLNKVYRFMRFSNEGTAFMSGSYFEPIPKVDYNEMPFGEFCRYTLQGNEIIIENFQHRSKLFKLLHADIKHDTIRFTYYKLKTFAGAKDIIEDEVYIKYKADLKTRVVFPE